MAREKYTPEAETEVVEAPAPAVDREYTQKELMDALIVAEAK